MSEIKWVYVSGPYTDGDVVENTRNAILAGLRLREMGYVPIIPHLFHFAHFLMPYHYQFWLDWDFDLLERCDAIVRLPGESPGADKEVAKMRKMGRLVSRAIVEMDPNGWSFPELEELEGVNS